MATVKIEVLDCVIDGNPKGSQLSIDDQQAKHLESIGYAKILPAPKRSTKAKTTTK